MQSPKIINFGSYERTFGMGGCTKYVESNCGIMYRQ